MPSIVSLGRAARGIGYVPGNVPRSYFLNGYVPTSGFGRVKNPDPCARYAADLAGLQQFAGRAGTSIDREAYRQRVVATRTALNACQAVYGARSGS